MREILKLNLFLFAFSSSFFWAKFFCINCEQPFLFRCCWKDYWKIKEKYCSVLPFDVALIKYFTSIRFLCIFYLFVFCITNLNVMKLSLSMILKEFRSLSSSSLRKKFEVFVLQMSKNWLILLVKVGKLVGFVFPRVLGKQN